MVFVSYAICELIDGWIDWLTEYMIDNKNLATGQTSGDNKLSVINLIDNYRDWVIPPIRFSLLITTVMRLYYSGETVCYDIKEYDGEFVIAMVYLRVVHYSHQL